MANFMGMTTSNCPIIKDPDKVQEIIDRYSFDDVEGDFTVEIEAGDDENDNDVYLLNFFGEDWPRCYCRDMADDEEDDEDEVDLEEFLLEVAPYLTQTFVVQSVGWCKLRYPLSAVEWIVEPGGKKVRVNHFESPE